MNKKTKIINNIAQELYKIRYPADIKIILKKLTVIENQIKKNKHNNPLGLSNGLLFELSTARNRELISQKEQIMLSKKTVAFFGMSVGSHASVPWIMTSRAKNIKISDPDIFDASNLNRIKYGWDSVGKYKVDVVRKDLENINPGIKVATLKQTNHKNMMAIINCKPTADAIVDEIDDFEAKLLLRKQAKKLKIPLLSAADVGDNIIVDIERYDTDKNCQFFNGRIKNIDKIDFKKLTNNDKKRLIIELVGFEDNSIRMLQSLKAIGKTIPTWPQLGPTAVIAGGIIATLLKKIFIGENIKSNRYYICLDDIFVADFNSKSYSFQRLELIKQLI